MPLTQNFTDAKGILYFQKNVTENLPVMSSKTNVFTIDKILTVTAKESWEN